MRGMTVIACHALLLIGVVLTGTEIAFSGEVLTSQELILRLDPNSPHSLSFRSLSRADTEPPSVDLDIRFEFNSSALQPVARAQLDALGRALSAGALKEYRFKIVGHTDAVGGDAYNQTLSAQRAKSVTNYLVANFDITPEHLVELGMGESQLKNAEDPEASENRRVEVINLGM